VQFGWGSRQRRIQAAEIDRTSAIAETIAQDKQLTKHLLKPPACRCRNGRPVRMPRMPGPPCRRSAAPVVVKPQDGNQGKGVTVNIDHARAARCGLRQAAAEYSSDVMVERFVPGHDFRLLVVGNKLVAAARRDPPHVIGDGVHTVRNWSTR
jgi:cyanophycin synthetase